MQLGLDFIQGSDFIPNQMPTWQYFRQRVRAARRRQMGHQALYKIGCIKSSAGKKSKPSHIDLVNEEILAPDYKIKRLYKIESPP